MNLLIIALDCAHVFECETLEGAECFMEAIRLIGHEPKILKEAA